MSDGKNSQSKDSENFCGGSLEYVTEQWDRLPPHICEATVALVDAAITTFAADESLLKRVTKGEISRIGKIS